MATSGGHYAKFYSTFTSLCRNRPLQTSGGALLGFNVLNLFENPDAIDHNVQTVKKAQLHKDETGMDRLRFMFSYDEFGDMSPELQMVSQGAMMGFFTGSIVGGTIQSKENYLKFLERNQATAFHSHIDAKKRLQDKVTLGFFRGAWMWGWRLSLFTGSITLFTTAISVYRGKSSIIEYLAGGAITGTLYKFKHGPKAMLAGGVVGGALGTMAGCVSLGLMYLTGTSMEEVRYWQYKWKEEHQEDKLAKLRKQRAEDMNPLIQSHEQISSDDLLDTIEVQATTDNAQEVQATTDNAQERSTIPQQSEHK